MAEEVVEEVECIDCGADIIADASAKEPRCDTCEAHHFKGCGEDCPIICEACKEHHFEPWNDLCIYTPIERSSLGTRGAKALRSRATSEQVERVLRRADEIEQATGFVIEFRNGGLFQNIEADRSGPMKTAQRFSTKIEADEFMHKHEWMMFAGGMIIPAKNEE